MSKSTVGEIRERFDAEVERFSNLRTGHESTVDARLAMSLVAEAAAVTTPHGKDVLDIGCGAGNYTLSLLELLPDLNVTLIDLSPRMLERAATRVGTETKGSVEPTESDIRELDLGNERFDIVLAAAVLHHLRSDDEWFDTFKRIFHALRPGGSFWIFDLIDYSMASARTLMKRRYGDYLRNLRDEAYRDHVFGYIEKEDTPKPLVFQLELLRRVGFTHVDVLHKSTCFAAFGAMKE